MQNHTCDLGPIAPLMADDTVTDILINGTDSVYVEQAGHMQRTELSFASDAAVLELATNIAKAIGREIDPAKPLVDARLADGSRVNIIAPPLAVDGTMISIRKFPKHHLTLDKMVEQGNISLQMGEFLKICGRSRLNIIISGGTGSGKTTLLNAMSQFIEHSERVVTVEDAAELRLNQPQVVRLETKVAPANNPAEEVTIRDLVRNALRMRPDRIIVGEVRGPEAFDMMQAMNTGHEGSFATIHANHPRDALARLENMMNMSNLGLPVKAIREQIASAIHLIIQTSRMRDGVRRITHITEVNAMEGDIITTQEIFQFIPGRMSEQGELTGEFRFNQIVPGFVRRATYWGEGEALAKTLGITIPVM